MHKGEEEGPFVTLLLPLSPFHALWEKSLYPVKMKGLNSRWVTLCYNLLTWVSIFLNGKRCIKTLWTFPPNVLGNGLKILSIKPAHCSAEHAGTMSSPTVPQEARCWQPERAQKLPLAEQNNYLCRQYERSAIGLSYFTRDLHENTEGLHTPHKLLRRQSFHCNHQHKTAAEPGGTLLSLSC